MIDAGNLIAIDVNQEYELPDITVVQDDNLVASQLFQSTNAVHFERGVVCGALLDGIVRERIMQFIEEHVRVGYSLKRLVVTESVARYHNASKAPVTFKHSFSAVTWDFDPEYSTHTMKLVSHVKRGKRVIASYDLSGQAYLERG